MLQRGEVHYTEFFSLKILCSENDFFLQIRNFLKDNHQIGWQALFTEA
jgi:hypothetical protein